MNKHGVAWNMTGIYYDRSCYNMVYTNPSRYLVADNGKFFIILVDEDKIVKAPNDRRCMIGWTFKELKKLCKQRKSTIEKVG